MIDYPKLLVVFNLLDDGGVVGELIKPKYGSPCNGCGLCCKMEVCALGLMAFGEGTLAPCPALTFDENRYWCGLVLAEKTLKTDTLLADALGIGKGCCAEINGE